MLKLEQTNHEYYCECWENNRHQEFQSWKEFKAELTDGIKKYWDDTAKAFKKDAPETLTKAYKSFKWNKALKGGGIAAGVALVLGYLFGSNA